MSINHQIGLDNTQLQADALRAAQLIKSIGDKAEAEALRIDNQFKGIGRGFAALGGTAVLTGYINKLIQIRGEFQQLEIAFTTMLRSKEKSDALMRDVAGFAATTPFDLKQVAAGTKQLLAYGFQAEDMTKNLSMLGNVASGVGSQIGDLIYLYGTLKASGRVTQMDMNQFAGRGIPIYSELAKVLGVNVDQVRSFVSAGRVGFPEIEKAFQGMVREGGMFYDLMQDQSKSLTGQISNLGDSFDMMFNKIGQSNEGILHDGIQLTATLVENYEQVGKVILSLIATYGAYKAAIITYSALQTTAVALEKGWTIAQLAHLKSLVLVEGAQKMLNKTMLANPYVLLATAVVGLAASMLLLADNTSSAQKAQKQYNEEKEAAADLEQKHKDKIEKLIDASTNQAVADFERIKALQALKEEYPSIFSQYDIEKLKLADILAIKKQIAEEDSKRKVQKNKENIADIDAQIANAQKAYQASIKSGANGYSLASQREYIDYLNQKRRKYLQDVEADNVNAFIVGITGISNPQLSREIELREKLIAKIGDSKNVGLIPGMGSFTKTELESQIAALKSEQDKRKQVLTTGAQDLMNANAELKRLQAERLKILTSGLTQQDREKKLKEIDEQIEEFEKKIKTLGGKESKKDSDARKKLIAEISKDELEQLRKDEDLIFQARQAKIDAMKPSTDKELEQLKLDHDKRISEINRQQDDLLRLAQENAEKVWKANGGKGKFDKSAVALTSAQIDSFASMRDSEYDAYKIKIDGVYKNLKDKYQDYADQRKAIEDNFQKDIAALTVKYGADSDPVSEAKRQLEKALKEISKTALSENGRGLLELYLYGDGSDFILSKIKEFFPLFQDITKLSMDEIQRVKELVEGIEIDPDVLELLKKAGVDVENLILKLKAAKDATDGMLDFQKWEKILDVANKLQSSLTKLGGALELSGGKIGKIGSIISGLAKNLGDISNVVTKLSSEKPLTSGDKLSIVDAGISGISDLYSMIANQINENKRAQEEWNEKILESAHNAALARIELHAYKEDNIFGVENPYQRAISGASQYAAAMLELRNAANGLNNGQVQVGDEKNVNWGNVAKGVSSGAAAGAAIGTIFAGFTLGLSTLIGAGIGAIVGGISGVLATKTVPIFESLSKKYGEIYNKDTFELNPKILDDYELLDDATKGLVDRWEEIRTKALEAQEQMRENFADLAGDIGNRLSETLVNSFRNGNVFGAIEDFKGEVTTMIEDIVEKMIFAQYFQSMFKGLQDDMMASFGEFGDQNIVDDIVRFFEQVPGAMDAWNAAMEAAQAGLAEKGFDVFFGKRNPVSKGAITASQDSINEQNGRLAAMQMHTFNINEGVKILQDNSAQALTHLAGIERNTSILDGVQGSLYKMNDSINAVKSEIQDMNLRGLKLRV